MPKNSFMKLYKYVSPYLWSSILKEKRIRFSPPAAFNDPFEMRAAYECLTEAAEVEENLTEDHLKTSLKEWLHEQYTYLPSVVVKLVLLGFVKALKRRVGPQGVEIACTMINGVTRGILDAFYQGLNENIGVLSLTEKPDDLLMWAHYAQNHKGFVIEFDGKHEYFHRQDNPSDDFHYVRKVNYSIFRPNICLTPETATVMLLTKSEDWKYEQEWRMLSWLEDSSVINEVDGEPIHLFSFSPTCITGIIFGCRMLPQSRKEMIEYLAGDEQYAHVRMYDAVLARRKFKLDIVPVRDAL
jgi:hypothetical protein